MKKEMHRRRVYFGIGVTRATDTHLGPRFSLHYESNRDATFLRAIRTDRGDKRYSHEPRRRRRRRGRTAKRGSASPRHETAAGSFTKNWRSSNQLTSFPLLPRTRRTRATAKSSIFGLGNSSRRVTKSFPGHLLPRRMMIVRDGFSR